MSNCHQSNHLFSLMLVHGLTVGVVGPFRNASTMPMREKFRSHGKGPKPMRLLIWHLAGSLPVGFFVLWCVGCSTRVSLLCTPTKDFSRSRIVGDGYTCSEAYGKWMTRVSLLCTPTKDFSRARIVEDEYACSEAYGKWMAFGQCNKALVVHVGSLEFMPLSQLL